MNFPSILKLFFRGKNLNTYVYVLVLIFCSSAKSSYNICLEFPPHVSTLLKGFCSFFLVIHKKTYWQIQSICLIPSHFLIVHAVSFIQFITYFDSSDHLNILFLLLVDCLQTRKKVFMIYLLSCIVQTFGSHVT